MGYFFYVEDLLVENVGVLNGYVYGIWFTSTLYSTVQNCYVLEFEDGIELSGKSEMNLVRNNTVELVE